MMGAIIGDVVGSKYEFRNIKTKEFPLLSDGCTFTDDSVMTIAVARAIPATPHLKTVALKMFPKTFSAAAKEETKNGYVELPRELRVWTRYILRMIIENPDI